jgi:hypothetical protein
MQRAIAFLSIAAVLLFAGAAFAADLSPEPAQYFGTMYVDQTTGETSWSNNPNLLLGSDVYSNIASPANFGFSSTSFTSVWGDRMTTVGTGILDQNQFTVYNGLGANLLTATVAVSFYDAVSSVLLGAYSTNVNFGAGLPAGSYALVNVTGINPLAINLNVTDIIVTQAVTAHTGATTRLGIASLDPVTIGLSASTMYINSSTVGPAGFYNVGTGLNANPGYRINVLQPVPTAPSTWGKVKSLYR